MAKWRTNKPLVGVNKASDDLLPVEAIVTPNVRMEDVSACELLTRYRAAFQNGGSMSLEYPGGIDQLEKDAAAECCRTNV